MFFNKNVTHTIESFVHSSISLAHTGVLRLVIKLKTRLNVMNRDES